MDPINLNQEFPHLEKAPIVEAVIEVRGRACVQWDVSQISDALRQRMENYPVVQQIGTVGGSIKAEKCKIASTETKDIGVEGIRFKNENEGQIAHFNINFFSFSKLAPYRSWENFSQEALRLWEIHQEILQPLEINRVGVRFINQIPLTDQTASIEDFFSGFPPPVPNFEVERTGFLYHDIVKMQDRPYFANIIKTALLDATGNQNPVLILDIDAYN